MSRFLDDEMGAETPVQIDRRQHAPGRDPADTLSREEFRIEDIFPGSLLATDHLDGLTLPEWADRWALLGKTGTVQRVDLNGMRARIGYNDVQRNLRFYVWIPFYQLRKPAAMWQDPCGKLQNGKLIEILTLTEEMVKTETALSILQARR
jgi:hypothetical protein